MQEKVKQLRVSIDGIAQLTNKLKGIEREPNHNPIYSGNCSSIQTENAYQSLIFAKAWLGKVMGELGVESPYKAGYKTKEDIEPTADVNKHNSVDDGDWINLPTAWYRDANHIEKVDGLRSCIDNLVKEVKELDANVERNLITREFSIARTNAYNYLCEARFHLGFELQRIKEA